MKLTLPDEDAEIAPVPTSGGRHMPELELDRLSNIIKSFNDQFGNIDWKDADRIRQVIADEIPQKVAADKAYKNAMKNSDKAGATGARSGSTEGSYRHAGRSYRAVQTVQ